MSTLEQYASTLGVRTNATLRTTFSLIAWSMLPTIAGAVAGFAMGFPALVVAHPIAMLLGALLVLGGLIFAICSTEDVKTGSVLFFAFTALMGVLLSGTLSAVLANSNGVAIVVLAAVGTAAITGTCALYAMTTKRDFSSMGGYLTGALIALILVGLLNLWLQLSFLALLLSFIGLLLFSAFLIYDVQKVVNEGETNPVHAALSIYLDIINIFQNLISMLSALMGDD